MTFDPGGPDGSGPPLQKEEGDVRSTKEYIISSSSACGLHEVRALIAKVAVKSSRELAARPLSLLPHPCVRDESGEFGTKKRIRGIGLALSDRRRPLLSRCRPAGRRRESVYYRVSPPLPPSSPPPPPPPSAGPPPGRCSSFSSSTSIAASSPPSSLKSCNKSRPARRPGASSTVELGTSGGLSREIRGRDSWKSSLGCLGDTG